MSSLQPFDACWSRVDRAEVHRAAAVRIWNDYLASHPFDFSLDEQGDGEFVLRVWQHEPVPLELSVILGEWLYNLRSALDYIVWATAVYDSGQLPPPGESELQYPIYDNPRSWESNLRRLKSLARHHRDMLEKMQPFNSPDPDANYLGWVNRLARSDRHRRLSVITAYVAELEPIIGFPPQCSHTLAFGDRVLVDGRADVARIKLTPWQPDWEVKINPRIGIDPEIADWATSPFWRGRRYDERFRMIQLFVMGEIAAYEYSCTGASRKAKLITDDFKAICDSRRRSRPITAKPRPETRWGPALPGRPSTLERFEGRDFPAHGPGSGDRDARPFSGQ